MIKASCAAAAIVGAGLHRLVGAAHDITLALRHPEAMTPRRRHLDEFKLATGVIAAGAGAAEISPLAAAAGALSAWEALDDLEQAGQEWEKKHHRARPVHRP